MVGRYFNAPMGGIDRRAGAHMAKMKAASRCISFENFTDCPHFPFRRSELPVGTQGGIGTRADLFGMDGSKGTKGLKLSKGCSELLPADCIAISGRGKKDLAKRHGAGTPHRPQRSIVSNATVNSEMAE